MTKTLSFDDIRDVLISLNERLKRLGKVVYEFYIDNCCSLRSKLQGIFGPQLVVLLDIFHAVQRITSKIPKRPPFHRECLRSLQLVFRDPSDHGTVRTKTTPPPDVLHRQMCKFKETWESIEYYGKTYFHYQ